ncbi:hypothetical protein ACFOTA_05210 [Chitinophaga sp. GCM10012297]|uniref:Uncharacterized protein n=1 Tax=Chitinophaga chungangae TaxID=2821488 RepID=A0ABS3YA94_9BACT|nr:hypothetical protein [Chitinophaga chungangae]MBO9151594.1 hypothetical protein [Chitinophaga chungangae]
MEMNPVWKKVLEEVGFVSWYRALSDEFRTEPPFTDHSVTEAQDMIMEFGFKKTQYDPKTSFYQVEGVDDTRIVKGLGSGVSVSLKDGSLEVVVAFDLDNDTRVGGTFSLLPGMLGDTGSPIRKPVFTNYKELYALLKKIFQKYDDIGNKVIDIYLAEPATM